VSNESDGGRAFSGTAPARSIGPASAFFRVPEAVRPSVPGRVVALRLRRSPRSGDRFGERGAARPPALRAHVLLAAFEHRGRAPGRSARLDRERQARRTGCALVSNLETAGRRGSALFSRLSGVAAVACRARSQACDASMRPRLTGASAGRGKGSAVDGAADRFGCARARVFRSSDDWTDVCRAGQVPMRPRVADSATESRRIGLDIMPPVATGICRRANGSLPCRHRAAGTGQNRPSGYGQAELVHDCRGVRGHRGMKMLLGGSVRSRAYGLAIRDRGLLWENADG
jgi:hypothetical protein